MDQYQNYNMPPQEEEEGMDIMAIVKTLWGGRKTIIIVMAIFFVLGLVSALTMKHTYTVSSVMVPQMSSRSNYSLGNLASIAGLDLGYSSSGGDLSPLVYPQIVNSVSYRKELLYTPLHFEKVDTAVSLYTYSTQYSKPTVMGKIRKYTLGLPGVIIGALKKPKPDVVLPIESEEGGSDDSPKPIVLSKTEQGLINSLASSVTLTVDRKEGSLTMTVVGSEPVMTAELAIKAQQLLQSEVTRFRTEKAQAQLDYIQDRYNEIKAEAEVYQTQLAAIKDRSQQIATARSLIERERLQNKYNVANAIYSEMAKQLEQAKMQVKRDTPLLAVLQPVTVPLHPSNSRVKTLILWIFFGAALGCGIVLGKSYLPKIKEMFAAVENDESKEK